MRLIDADATIKTLEELTELCRGEGAALVKALVFAALRTQSIIPTVGGWVSVKDKLPEPKINPLTQDFAWVICYCDFGGEPKRTDVRFYGFGKPSWDEKAHFLHGGQVMDGVVTHWMPLPEPPEGSGEYGAGNG